jgi:hypothetical protein
MTAPAAHYGANVGPVASVSEGRVTFDIEDNNKDDSSSMSGLSKRSSLKKANLYAWLSLQKLPEVCDIDTVEPNLLFTQNPFSHFHLKVKFMIRFVFLQ